MKRVLVLFGTTDGHTRKVAERLGDTLRELRSVADIVEAGTADVAPDDYDGIIVCASIHAGGYQRSVKRWVRQYADRLRPKPTAFVSVCLAVLQKDAKVAQDLDAIVTRFVNATSWQPTVVKKVAGALLYRQYGVIKRWMMKRIVTKAGGDTDTSRNYEYTDWNDLRAFASDFVRLLSPRASVKVAAGF